MSRLLIFALLAAILPYSNLYADDFDITATGQAKSDTFSKQKDLLIKLYQNDDKKRYSNKISLRIDKNSVVSGGVRIRNRDLLDYENGLKFFDEEQEKFLGLYLRHKDDRVRSSLNQNYTIASIGCGIHKEKDKKGLFFEFFIGQRHNVKNDILILRPALTFSSEYKKLEYELSSSVIGGKDFSIFKNTITLGYPLSKGVSLKYILDFERSKDNGDKFFERLNKVALSLKF